MLKTLIFLLAVLMTTPASACPLLEKASPKVGSEVSAPDHVELEFSSRIYPEQSTLIVSDANGKQYNTGKAYGKPGDENFIATKLASLPPGKYKVSWNVFCDCGSLTPGDYKFTVN